MQITPHLDDERIDLTFPDASAMRTFLDEAKAQGAFMLELPAAPAPFVMYEVRLVMGSWFDYGFEASVVQTFDAPGGTRAVFQFDPWPPATQAEFEARLRGETGTADEATTSEEEGTEEEGGPTLPIMRIRQMSVPEKMRLASKADRTERAILLRDGSPQVLLALLNNPRLGSDDIRQIAGSPLASTAVIERIAKERKWTTNSQVQRALVQNPKTPMPIALRFVDLLPTEDLRKMGKLQSGLKEKLRTACLKSYLKRTQQR